jgi:hypothetical protein
VRVRLVPESAVRSVDPAGLSFFNVNAAEDYEKLLGMNEPRAR